MDSLQHGTNNVLTNSGSKHNLRWEISQQTPKKGTFTLLIRRGDDSIKRKVILESWNNLSLDPNASNYISKVIGDTFSQTNFLQQKESIHC